MKSFVLSALTVVLACAQDATPDPFDHFKVVVDGSVSNKYVRSLNFSSVAYDDEKFHMYVRNNNNLMIKNREWDGEEYAFKPYLKGGHITFEVDLSHMDCGCVAGLYAVDLSNNCNQEES